MIRTALATTLAALFLSAGIAASPASADPMPPCPVEGCPSANGGAAVVCSPDQTDQLTWQVRMLEQALRLEHRDHHQAEKQVNRLERTVVSKDRIIQRLRDRLGR